MDLAIDARFAHPPRNELGVLGAEVQDQNHGRNLMLSITEKARRSKPRPVVSPQGSDFQAKATKSVARTTKRVLECGTLSRIIVPDVPHAAVIRIDGTRTARYQEEFIMVAKKLASATAG